MGWTLLPPGNAKPGASSFRLPDEGKIHLVTSVPSPKIGCVHELKDYQTELGRVTTGSWGAKIEATRPGLILLSAHANEHPSMLGAGFELWSDTDSSATSFFLRHGDVLKSSTAPGSLVLTWTTSEVQVNSSAAEVEVENKRPERGNGIAETDEEETGDEEDLDATMTVIETSQRKSQQLRATPHLSNQTSTVVQETPTADRVNGALDDTAVPELQMTPIRAAKVNPSETVAVESEQYSTARTGESQYGSEGNAGDNRPDQAIIVPEVKMPDVKSHESSAGEPENTSRKTRHPKVVVPSKRPSPPADSDAPGKKRSTKRTKKDTRLESNTQESTVSSTPAKKSRSRLSEVKGSNEFDVPRTSRSPRSSQGTNAQVYEGPKPAVALSNSSILPGHQSVKFLKKQGGALVESMKDTYNILCIRDGSLHKTAKVLQAIAMGIPIVTDKWLLDSAKIGHFLSVEDYKPSVPEQEKEWNFRLENVLGQPQKPFDGYKVHFTTKLQSDYSAFAEIEQVCMAAGAKKVTTKKMDKTGAVIVLASDKGDDEAEALMQEDVICYQRDLLPLTIFRGSLDLDNDEFRMKAGGTANSSTKDTTKRRGRKS